jgi:hypothetical protein
VGSATRGLWRSPALYGQWRARRVRIARQGAASRDDGALREAMRRRTGRRREAGDGRQRPKTAVQCEKEDRHRTAAPTTALWPPDSPPNLPDLSPYRGPELRGGEHRATPLVMRVRTAKPDPTATGRRRHESAPGQGRIGVASHQPSSKRQCGRGLRRRDRTPSSARPCATARSEAQTIGSGAAVPRPPGVDHLDRDGGVETLVQGPVDAAAAALADHRL